MNARDTREELRQAFRQVVLTIGGIFSVYQVDDDLVWAITRGLDQVIAAHLRPTRGTPSRVVKQRRSRPRPHPAVVELLAGLASPSNPTASPASQRCAHRSSPGPRSQRARK